MKLKSYAEQRKERLQSVVDDYLCDQDVTSSEFYLDLKESIEDWSKYHQEQFQKANKVSDLLDGLTRPARHGNLDALD
mgnify:CR=1 FL=1|tara:strand:- start:353 stop:586 length:234 start_codon:yes stop_codon:yes gene_type:complete